uniref:Uncharacterized protein n=1 Tax=Avena sativa TaxID=4498 RepID=A0ACD5ZZT1_AVESA
MRGKQGTLIQPHTPRVESRDTHTSQCSSQNCFSPKIPTSCLAETLDQMARYSRALLLPSLLLACAIVQSSYCSRSPPGEPEVVLSPAVRGDDGTPSTEAGATGHGHRTGADADGAAATSALGGVGGGAGSAPQRGGRAKLARRVLQGGAAADSAAGSSCRSHDARVTCPPPAGGVALRHVRP